MNLDHSNRPSCDSDTACGSKDGLLEDVPPYRQRERRLSTVVLGIMCIILSVSLGIVSTRTSSGNCDGQGYWRDSEFATVTKELPPVYREELFEPTLRFNTSHRIYRPHLTPDYVGTPTPEIDAAWEELIGAVNVFVTPQEASNWKMGGNLWLDPETGLHMAQVSVMHDLHCLDMLRRFIYLDHYPDMDDYTLRPHVEHCLDGLRRSLMCHGDMTFIPIEWSENRGWIMPIFDTVYTCRDYDALRKWTRDRDAADPKVYPQNAERLWLKSSGSSGGR